MKIRLEGGSAPSCGTSCHCSLGLPEAVLRQTLAPTLVLESSTSRASCTRVGVLLLAVAPVLWGLAVAQVRELRRGTLLHATVMGHSTYMRRGQAMYSARFAVTIDGQTIEGTSQMATIGALVPVRHRPGDEVPLRDVSLAQYLAAATYAVLGTALGGVGVGVLMGGNPAWW